MSNYQQGKIIILDEELRKKYKGDIDNIVFRSSWERVFFKKLILNKNVTKLNMEEVIIPYVSPLDGKVHRYFMDFYFELITKSGEKRKFIVEVKPYIQTQKPVMSKTKTGRETQKRKMSYQKKLNTFMVNVAKWKSAKEFARLNNMTFMIWTDNPKVNFKYDRDFKLWSTEELGLNF